jgi:hypothetical protein
MAGRTSGQAVFQRQWQTYRKIVAHNYLYHRTSAHFSSCGLVILGLGRAFN